MNAYGQTNNDDAHVYVVDTLGCSANGKTLFLDEPAGRIVVLIENDYGPQSNEDLGTRVLAHELGHGLGLQHVNTPWASCSSSSAASRNLMCQNAGRLLQDSQVPTQCTNIRNSTAYADRN